MKLTMEILNDTFTFEYSIGKDERHGGTYPLSSEALRHFTSCMETCHGLWSYGDKKFTDELNARCYLEAHPEFFAAHMDKAGEISPKVRLHDVMTEESPLKFNACDHCGQLDPLCHCGP